MNALEIRRADKLGGAVAIPGAKNSVLALLAAACLSDESVTLHNVPGISDVAVVADIIRGMGGRIERVGRTAVIDPEGIGAAVIDPTDAKKIRTAYYFIGALLARFGHVSVGYAGGDDFVHRPIDQHLKGFRAMGATVAQYADHYVVEAPRLVGADILFDTITSGATMNLMMAAVRAKGRTVLRNAARDPEVVDLAVLLNEMGASVVGAGTDVIRIEGVSRLRGATHAVIPDRLIAASLITALGVTGGRLVLENVVPEHLANLTAKYGEIGYSFETDHDQLLVAETDGRIQPTRARIGMYPLFSPDFQQPLSALLLKAQGVSVISDRIYPLRFNQCPEFLRMGATLRYRAGSVRIHGGRPLTGMPVHAGDIRAGTALIIAGLLAEGTTILTGAEHLERGFEDVVSLFSDIGAPIRRLSPESLTGHEAPGALA